MTTISDIQKRLHMTRSEILAVEKAIASNPRSRSLQLMAQSLKKAHRELEEEFLGASEEIGLEVCSYRMFVDDQMHSSPGILGISEVLNRFQHLYTITYDAVVSGPKKKAIVSTDLQRKTEFEFGYAFAGSTGIVLTVPERRRDALFEDPAAEEASHAVMKMLNAQGSRDIHDTFLNFGPAVVRALLSLSEAHVRSETGVEIQWRRGPALISQGLFELPQFRNLKVSISDTSEVTVDNIDLVGTLTEVNTKSKHFEIETDSGVIIKGHYDDAITAQGGVIVPMRYSAHLVKETKFQFAFEKDLETYFLESLQVVEAD